MAQRINKAREAVLSLKKVLAYLKNETDMSDPEAKEELQAVTSFLAQRQHRESGKSGFDFSHLYGEHGGQVKAADETPTP